MEHTFHLQTKAGMRKAVLFSAGGKIGLTLVSDTGQHIGKYRELGLLQASKLVTDYLAASPAFRKALIWATLGYEEKPVRAKPLAMTITHPGLSRTW
jgi:hypothetical protein